MQRGQHVNTMPGAPEHCLYSQISGAAFPAGVGGKPHTRQVQTCPSNEVSPAYNKDEHSLLIFLEQNLLFQKQSSSQKSYRSAWPGGAARNNRMNSFCVTAGTRSCQLLLLGSALQGLLQPRCSAKDGVMGVMG